MLNEIIKEKFNQMIPLNYNGFKSLSKEIATKIIFGTDIPNEDVYQIFKDANTIKFLFKTPKLSTINEYNNYLQYFIRNPINPSLMFYAKQYQKGQTEYDIIQQIPHWIFPITGLIATQLPRILILLFKLYCSYY